MTRWIVALSLLAGLAVHSPRVPAQDRVILKNGSVFTGAVVGADEEAVSLESPFGVIRFRRGEVERIERGTAPVHGIPKPEPARKPARPARNSPTRAPRSPSAPTGFVRAVPGSYGELKKIRFDRHPAYDSLRRSRPGAWVRYATEASRPRHDQERWVVESVAGNRAVVLKELWLSGKAVGYERMTLNHLDYGPQMPAPIQKHSAFGKELIRNGMGLFATLRVTEEPGGDAGATRYYCAEVPILGLVKAESGPCVLRELVGFGWEGGGAPPSQPHAGATSSSLPPAAGAERAPAPPPHPVAAAFFEARPGDFAIWEHPGSARLTREFVREATPQQVTVVMQVFRDGAFRFEGVRIYDLAALSRDYLERIEARRAGEETFAIGARKLVCQKWRSASGNVEYWTSPEVHIGALVQQAINGEVVSVLRESGHDPRLVER